MKKTVFLLLAILLISFSYQSECSEKESAKDKKDCNSLNVTASSNKCCYVHSKGHEKGEKDEEYKYCEEITEEIYNRIKDFIKDAEKAAKDAGGKLDVKKFDCSSNYLLISIMSLILLLFL